MSIKKFVQKNNKNISDMAVYPFESKIDIDHIGDDLHPAAVIPLSSLKREVLKGIAEGKEFDEVDAFILKSGKFGKFKIGLEDTMEIAVPEMYTLKSLRYEKDENGKLTATLSKYEPIDVKNGYLYTIPFGDFLISLIHEAYDVCINIGYEELMGLGSILKLDPEDDDDEESKGFLYERLWHVHMGPHGNDDPYKVFNKHGELYLIDPYI